MKFLGLSVRWLVSDSRKYVLNYRPITEFQQLKKKIRNHKCLMRTNIKYNHFELFYAEYIAAKSVRTGYSEYQGPPFACF